MRTIIINTLGSELRKNPLFYLPFDESVFHWIEKDISKITECTEDINAYLNNQDKRQDYHLIILASLAMFGQARHTQMREQYLRFLKAYIMQKAIKPLLNLPVQDPKKVYLVFTASVLDDKSGGIPDGEEIDHIFKFSGDLTKLDSLVITSDDGNVSFDMTDLYEENIIGFKNKYQNELKRSFDENKTDSLELLRNAIDEKTEEYQKCQYFLPGKSQPEDFVAEHIIFSPRTDDWELLSADLQLNLCNFLAKTSDGGECNLEDLKPSDEQKLQQTFSVAKLRIAKLLKDYLTPLYYPLKTTDKGVIPTDISSEIQAELINSDSLPWIKEQKYFTISGDAQDSPQQKLRHAWLTVIREKKRFDALYAELYDQYDSDKSKEQEKTILGVCLKRFMDWRRQILSAEKNTVRTPSENDFPIFNDTQAKEELDKAHEAYGKTSAECIENYDDLRQEAEVIKSKVNKAFRLWPGDGVGSTGKFCLYSICLGVLFILQMILPYIGITMTEGASLSRYVHFFTSLSLFAAAYLAGVIFWLRALCKELAKYTSQMNDLLIKSGERRKASIIGVVNLYGRILLDCTLKYDNLKELEAINKLNIKRKDKFNAHRFILQDALEKIDELFTALRMEFDAGQSAGNRKGELDFSESPTSAKNRNIYNFFSERWGS